MKTYTSLFTSLLFLLVSINSQAEQKQSLGDWDIHYSAFSSTFLTPDIASIYDINRSRYTGVITITVLNRNDQTAQDVSITGTAKNLLGVLKPLEFKPIKEGKSVYYITEIDYRNEETYRIQLNIKQDKLSEALKFQHTFYVE